MKMQNRRNSAGTVSAEHGSDAGMDMTTGPLAGKVLLFALPVMFSGVLQLLFNAADMIIVGQFAGSEKLAAVGSNGALINLIVNLLTGLSIGSGVVTAFYFGAGEKEQVKETIHTSVAVSLIGGVIFGLAGVVLSPSLLRAMGTPENVQPLAELYLRIYFLGFPAMSVYNFGSSILRSMGDTRRPLYYLALGGIANVLLDTFLVAAFHWDVAGAALATVVSQAISGALLLRRLMKLDPEMNLEWKKVRISRSKLLRIMRIGIPAGLQSMIFSLSNVVIQSTVNSFGETVVAGNSAAANIEGFIYIAMNSFYQAAQTFTSQNVGARKYERINKVLFCCLVMVTATGIMLGQLAYSLGRPLLKIYLPDDAEAIRYGLMRMRIISLSYFLCGLMDVMSGMIRGMGESLMPMIVSMLGSCLLRIIWIYTYFPQHRTLTVLFLSYPISWILTGGVHLICYFLIKRQLTVRYAPRVSTTGAR